MEAAIAADRMSIVAGLIRSTGDWELAEDSLQDALERALQRWPIDGIPANPGGWLRVTAQRRAIDVIRRRRREQDIVEDAEAMGALTGERPDQEDEGPLGDDRLRLLFACCHPALPLGGRVALTLRTVLGRSVRDIARVFLVSEATMSQRILRTRQRIEHTGISLRVPPMHRVAERLEGVRAVLYLLFTDGYPTTETDPLRDALALEAIDLTRLVGRLAPDDDETLALLALMLFQQSRRDARTDAAGEPLTMEEQDRSRWDEDAIAEGLAVLGAARASGRPAGRYRIQAGIAALHALAPTAADTDWAGVVALFDELEALGPSPVVRLNRAVAIAFRDGPEVGLEEVDAVIASGGGHDQALVATVRADLLRRAGRVDEARDAFQVALELTPEGPERRLVARRLRELGGAAEVG